MVLPFSNALGSVRRWTMPLPLPTSSRRLAKPWTRFAPLVSLVRLTTSGLVAAKFAGRNRVQILVEEEAGHRSVRAVARALRRPCREAASMRADRRRGSRDNKDRPAIRRPRNGGRAASRSACRTSVPVQKSLHCLRGFHLHVQELGGTGRHARSATSPAAWASANGSNGRVGLVLAIIYCLSMSRLTMTRMTWLVPSRIEWTRRSRQKRSIG